MMLRVHDTPAWGSLCARCARPSVRNVCRRCARGLAARVDRPPRVGRGVGGPSVTPTPRHLRRDDGAANVYVLAGVIIACWLLAGLLAPYVTEALRTARP